VTQRPVRAFARVLDHDQPAQGAYRLVGESDGMPAK
jgi:hypothetical protein